jgi:hypothetical protein
MARPWPPKQIPIDKVLEVARKLRILADKIELSSQAIAKTGFKEPWILYWPSAEDSIEFLKSYSAGLYEQQTKMEMGDPGAPKADKASELSEKAKKTLKLVRKAMKPKKKPPSKSDS